MNRVEDLAWDDVERRLASGASALLPIGAAAKEHGLHLPMNTDAIQAGWLSERLAERQNLLVWPIVTYGYYPAFLNFAGSISLSRPLFTTLIREILEGISAWRPRAIFVLDTGISTLPAVCDAIGQLTGAAAAVHLRIHAGPHYRETANRLRQQAFGSHADELETSRMLALAPGSVNMARAVALTNGPFEGPLTRVNAPSGVYGDPTMADAAKGEALIAAMLQDLNEQIAMWLDQTGN